MRLHFGDDDLMQIVGVVGNVRHDGYGAEQSPELYVPVHQVPWRFATFMVRAQGDASALVAEARNVLTQVDPLQPVHRATLMTDVLRGSVAQPRFIASLLSVFAVSALLLAALGIFGLISYSVGERTNEIGIRIALGADGGSVLGLIMRRGLLLFAAGGALGLLGGAALTRLVTSQLHEVTPLDPAVYGLGVLVLGAAALGATWLPARRATRIDPVRALRGE